MLRALAFVVGFFVVGLILVVLTAETGGPLEREGGADFPVPPVAPATATPTVVLASCANPEARVSWADAERYINRRVAIIGPVADVRRVADGVEVTVGFGPEEPLYVQILQSALPANTPNVEDLFRGQTLCVNGVVQRVNNRHQVIIDKVADFNLS